MQTPQNIDENTVNLPELLARVEYDRDLLREVFDIFLEEFPLLHTELKEALDAGDLKKVRVAAHTLKGMLASLSFSNASACAHRIERMATDSAPGGIAEELDRLERNAALAQANLESACSEVIQ